MIILLTNENSNLPIKYQNSDYPKIINTITTLSNLEITKNILENDNLFKAYLKLFSHHINDYQNSIVIIDNNFPLEEIKTTYKLININNSVNEKELEVIINENTCR